MVGVFGLGDLFARLEAERGTMMALVMAFRDGISEARGVRSSKIRFPALAHVPFLEPK